MRAAALFIHGLFSSPRTWSPLLDLLEQDQEIAQAYDLIPFQYASPRSTWSIRRSVPDLGLVADSLKTYVDVDCAEYDRLVIVAHSQGGLVVQRFVARLLADGRGPDLVRLRRVVLIACPNTGSEFFLSMRRGARWWNHPQERDLRPFSSHVTEAQRKVMKGAIYARHVAGDSCPIPFAVYAGESDKIVTPESAQSVFPHVGALPGDHQSVLRANSSSHRTLTAIKADLRAALTESSPTFLDTLDSDVPPEMRSASAHPSSHIGPAIRVTKRTRREGSVVFEEEMEVFDAQVAQGLADRWTRSSNEPLA